MGGTGEFHGYVYIGVETAVDSTGVHIRLYAFPAQNGGDWTRAEAWAAEYPGRSIITTGVAPAVLLKQTTANQPDGLT